MGCGLFTCKRLPDPPLPICVVPDPPTLSEFNKGSTEVEIIPALLRDKNNLKGYSLGLLSTIKCYRDGLGIKPLTVPVLPGDKKGDKKDEKVK